MVDEMDADFVHLLWSDLGFVVIELGNVKGVIGPHDDYANKSLAEQTEKIQQVRKKLERLERSMRKK